MKPRRSPAEWRRVVLRCGGITDSTRVLMLVMAEHMRLDLTVSIPRRDLARWLNRSEKRIQERIKNAHDAGLLDTVSQGHRGHTAVYTAMFPNVDSGTDSRALSAAGIRPPMRPVSGTPGGPTISKRPPELSPRSGVPDERRSEERAAARPRAEVRAAVDNLRENDRREKTA